MPYVSDIKRSGWETTVAAESPGELNFIFSHHINNYLQRYGHCYDTINECIGALECAKLELYRRIAAPYEDIKIEENGDVYTGPPGHPYYDDKIK